MGQYFDSCIIKSSPLWELTVSVPDVVSLFGLGNLKNSDVVWRIKRARWMDVLCFFNAQVVDQPFVLISLDENHWEYSLTEVWI